LIALLLAQDRVLIHGPNSLFRIAPPAGLELQKVAEKPGDIVAQYTNGAGDRFTIAVEARDPKRKGDAEDRVDRRLIRWRQRLASSEVRKRDFRENVFKESASRFSIASPDGPWIEIAVYLAPKSLITFEGELTSADPHHPGLIQFEQLFLSYAFITDNVKKGSNPISTMNSR
jgi:hypothetical protein